MKKRHKPGPDKQRREAKRRLQQRREAGDWTGTTLFECQNCGVQFRNEGIVLIGNVEVTLSIGDAGEVFEISPEQLPLVTDCPVCHTRTSAVAIDRVLVERDGIKVAGSVFSQKDLDQLENALEDLRKLHAQAGVDEVVEILERQGLGAFASYIRDNHQFLITTGLALVAIVIGLLQYFQAVSADEKPTPPDGITREQMERLLDKIGSMREGERNEGKRQGKGHDRHGDHGSSGPDREHQ